MLETRSPLAMDLMAAQQFLAEDVNGDGTVAPLDALEVINCLNGDKSSNPLNSANSGANAGQLLRFDTNGDQQVSSLDALIVVNDLNAHGARKIEIADLGDDTLSQLRPAHHDNLQQLFSAANAVRAHGKVTSLEIVKLMRDLTTALHEANVSATSIQAVVDDFQAVVSSGADATKPLLAVLSKLTHECLNNPPPPAPPPALQSLATDMKAIIAAGSFTADQLAAIEQDIGRLHDSGATPSDATTTQFLNDVLSLTGKTGTPVDPATLKTDFVAMLQSAGYSAQEIERLVGAVLRPHGRH